MNEHAKPLFPPQQQSMPGATAPMRPKPDHGEDSYRGSGKLKGKKAMVGYSRTKCSSATALTVLQHGRWQRY
jgi:hypothetical protein